MSLLTAGGLGQMTFKGSVQPKPFYQIPIEKLLMGFLYYQHSNFIYNITHMQMLFW